MSGGTDANSRVMADTVNMAEPMPPAARQPSSHQKSPASPISQLDAATMKMPTARVRRPPILSRIQPQKGLVASLVAANIETTMPTRKSVAPKDAAKVGSTGTSTPKPTATKKAIRPSTSTSRDSPPTTR